MSDKPKAVILLSGGLDSSTILAIAKQDGFEPYALSFRYGQRHEHELVAAQQVAQAQGVAAHVVAQIDLATFGGSALTDSNIEVPKARSKEEMGDGIPVTYVPARNTIFLSFGLAWAEVLGSRDIYIGVNAIDYSGYPDCRPEYIAAYESMANLATKAGVQGQLKLTIHAPLMELSKGGIVKRGMELGVDYSMTCTCYDPSSEGKACGRCDACILRLQGFEKNGIPDPAPYVDGVR